MRAANVVLTIVVIVLAGALGYIWYQQAITRVEGVVFMVGVGVAEIPSKSSIPKKVDAVVFRIFSGESHAPINLFLVTDGQYKDSGRLGRYLGKKISGVMEERAQEISTEYNDGTTVSKETLLCRRLLFWEFHGQASLEE